MTKNNNAGICFSEKLIDNSIYESFIEEYKLDQPQQGNRRTSPEQSPIHIVQGKDTDEEKDTIHEIKDPEPQNKELEQMEEGHNEVNEAKEQSSDSEQKSL